jgi:hypothetical protein
MFNKKDYRTYFKQLYEVEIIMRKEGEELLKLVKDIESQKLLKSLVADEIRHAKIVKQMLDLI